MELSAEARGHVERLADDTLEQFEKIAAAAQTTLETSRGLGPETLASINTYTSGEAVQSLGRIDHSKRESCRLLVSEPAIARVVVADEDGTQQIYYICRTTAVSGVSNLASYRAPIGRLASLSVGSELTLPNGEVLEVLERAQLRPTTSGEGWDSRDTVIDTEDFGPVTVESLKAFLEEAIGPEEATNLLGALLAQEELSANVFDGVRRAVITKMGLRDQPVLDQYQDEIFRLSLDKRLLILGPPGTGKTTTLIRRLGQKLDVAFLDEDERRLVEGTGGSTAHSDSWVMFTPTELLKQYLKEAFAREGVPASDHRIRTWKDYQRELSRGIFGILRSSTGSGTFILKETSRHLATDATDTPIEWFEDFHSWQRGAFIEELRLAARSLADNASHQISEHGRRLAGILDRAGDTDTTVLFTSLAANLPAVQELVSRLKKISDEKIERNLNLLLNRDRGFVNELARFIDGLQQVQGQDTDELDDPDLDDEDENTAPRTKVAAAVTAYMQAVRAQARAVAQKRTLAKTSRNAKILEWLKDRTLSVTDLGEVGASLLVQASARKFINPVKRYVGNVPKRYRTFRRMRQEDGRWYLKEGNEARDIHPLEVDVVLLSMLKAAGGLLSKSEVINDLDSPAWSSLKPIVEIYQNQVLVDEATDFSAIQLACMASLANPKTRSFCACGDFNQRLTTWGTRSASEIKWVFSDLEIREITVSYRQTKQLNELARAIIYAAGGDQREVSLPLHVDNEGVSPALLESAADKMTVVDWLSCRIKEVEWLIGHLPSIAVFVNSESEVAPLAETLNELLIESNIKVVACPQGQVKGQENDVLVFDVQHIKGLEFEAVFFISVDGLAEMKPELFDKYLYVGATRAATYLGITCDETLPASIDGLRNLFVHDWKPQGM